MNINETLLITDPPTEYDPPGSEILGSLGNDFPLLAQVLQDDIEDPVLRGLAASLLTIFTNAPEDMVEDGFFRDSETKNWSSALLEADAELQEDQNGTIVALGARYPHIQDFFESAESPAFAAGVVLGWMLCDDPSNERGIEADPEIPNSALRLVGPPAQEEIDDNTVNESYAEAESESPIAISDACYALQQYVIDNDLEYVVVTKSGATMSAVFAGGVANHRLRALISNDQARITGTMDGGVRVDSPLN